MFRYYQKTDDQKARWETTPDRKNFIDQLLADKAPMITILAVNQQIAEVKESDEFDPTTLRYRGPLYFDIDSDDLNKSIVSVRKLISKLQALDVSDEDIWVWATGKKGFHIVIDQKVFNGGGRNVRALPWVYRDMAQQLYVDNLDMVVYSCGRGRMWRTPNIKRANGKYKVPLTIPEVESITVEMYDRLVSAPRNLPQTNSGRVCAKLAEIYELAKLNVQKYIATLATVTEVPEEELSNFSDEDGCIQALITQGDKDNSNFNQAALQLAAYIKSKYKKEEVSSWISLVETMAENVKSATYKSKYDKVQHIKGAVYRAFADKHFVFSRRALFAVIKPCGDCPICKQGDGKGEEYGSFDLIEARDQGYFAVYSKAEKQLTTFTLDPICFHTEDAEFDSRVRTGIVADVVWTDNDGTHCRHRMTLLDTAWLSRGNFVKAFLGVGNIAVYLNDNELQRLKNSVFGQMTSVTEIHQVPSYGIHWHKVGSKKSLVYVEPAFSITSSGEQGTHALKSGSADAQQCPPNFYEVSPAKPGDEKVAEVIRHLCNINDPIVVAQILGWTAACMLKPQLITILNQFPLLNLYGNAGSGKSKTAHLFGYLHGCDYEMEYGPLGLENTTPYAISAMVASSTTVMRIIDECNPSTVKKATYEKFTGVAKSAWQSMEETKGSIGSRGDDSGPIIRKMRLSGPIAYLSEQKPDRPAIRERSVMVGFSKHNRNVEGRSASFMHTYRNRHLLMQVGKQMVTESLSTHPNWVHEQMSFFAPKVPEELDQRPHYSFCVVLMGLEFFKRTLKAMAIDCQKELDALTEALLQHLNKNTKSIIAEKSRSEADIIIESLGVLAAQPHDAPICLRPEEHYFVRGGDLILDPVRIQPEYAKWVKQIGDILVVKSPQMMTSVLEGELYFKGITVDPKNLENPQPFVKLDRELIKKRGINVFAFKVVEEV